MLFFVLLLRRSRRFAVPASDSVAIPPQLHAPIPLPPFRRIVPCDRLGLPKSTRGDRRARHALLRKKIPHRIRAPLGKLLVEFIASHAVRVPFYLQIEPQMPQHDPENLPHPPPPPPLHTLSP